MSGCQGCGASKHGVHVLVEKPLAPTVAEGRLLVDAAKAAGVSLPQQLCSEFKPGLDVRKKMLEMFP